MPNSARLVPYEFAYGDLIRASGFQEHLKTIGLKNEFADLHSLAEVLLSHFKDPSGDDNECKAEGCTFVCQEIASYARLLTEACGDLTGKRVVAFWEGLASSQWGTEFAAHTGTAALFDYVRAADIFTDGVANPTAASSKTWGQETVLRADLARNAGLTGKDVVIAVVDTGVDARAVASFKPALERGLKFVEGKPMAESLNVADCEDGPWNDEDMHGTAVAALVAGQELSKDLPQIGLATGCTLIPIKVSTNSRDASPGSLALAIGIAASFRPDIIVTTFDSDQERVCLKRATSLVLDLDILLIASAGNKKNGNSMDLPAYPARRCGVVSVAALDEGVKQTSWTNNDKVDIIAPGERIWAPLSATDNSVIYDYLDGTSMAAPLAAGTVAVVLEYLRNLHPGKEITAKQAFDYMLANMQSPPGEPGSKPILTLHGVI